MSQRTNSTMSSFLDQIVHFYNQNDWKSVIELINESNVNEARKILWVWPNESNLAFIDRILNDYNLIGIISLGCGCGLLEWIIQMYTKKTVIGYEVNREWWESRYSNPQFLRLKYPKLPLENNFGDDRRALLFCYFNNRPAFDDYMQHYEGRVVFIIGPGRGRGTHTNPEPFAPEFHKPDDWTLVASMEVRTTKDFIAVYAKNQ